MKIATEKTYTVYKHTSPSGKVYIGITRQKPEKRWSAGNGYKGNPYFWAAIQKYGWQNFTHEILADGLSKTDAEAMEVQLISEHRSSDHNFGYNLDLGGRSTGMASVETRKKMSLSRIGHPVSDETRQKISRNHLGVPLSEAHIRSIQIAGAKRRGIPMPEETKQKISNALSNRERSEAHCRALSLAKMGHAVSDTTRLKISATKRSAASTPRGAKNPKSRQIKCVETGRTYPTIADAIKEIGCKNIGKCCRGLRNTCGGYHWQYVEEDSVHVDS